jgi:thioesterase domain-containing protein
MAIRMIQPHGPYRIVGHSYGGVVAYEMTRQLLEQGEDVEYLALIDSMTPAVIYQHSLSDEFEDLRQLCADLAEKCGQLFELSSLELRGMPTEELLKLLHKLGIALKREEYDRIYAVFKANRRCYELYKPGALPRSTKVLLFRATQSLPDAENRPEDYGWKAVMKQELHRYDVQADHYSILGGDAVLALSRVLISTGSTVHESLLS